jgi:hypothetical protein
VIGDLLAGFGQPQGEKQGCGDHPAKDHANRWQGGGEAVDPGRRGNQSG